MEIIESAHGIEGVASVREIIFDHRGNAKIQFFILGITTNNEVEAFDVLQGLQR